MQTYLDWLDKSVAARIQRGDAGPAVFIRLFLQLSPDHGLLEPALASALKMASGWTGAAVTRVHAQGAARNGYLTLLAGFANGQSALLTVEAAAEPSVSLLVVARHGTIKLEDFPEPGQFDAGSPAARPAESALIQRSLAERRAVEAAR